MVLPAATSLTMALGAGLGALARRRFPDATLTPIAAGLVAGASVTGVVMALVRTLARGRRGFRRGRRRAAGSVLVRAIDAVDDRPSIFLMASCLHVCDTAPRYGCMLNAPPNDLVPSSPPQTRRAPPRLAWMGVAIGALGAGLWLTRWLVQGEGTVWTDVARRFYVADATLGWTQTEASWVWVGLDGLGVVAGVVVGTLAAMLLGRRLAGKPGKVVRALALMGAAVALLAPVVPAWAFVTGLPPAGAEIVLPDRPAPIPSSAVPLRARRLVVADSPKGNLLAVRIAAGGETFDARFGPLTGAVDLDTRTGTLSAPAASIETGVALRDSHAKEYLEAERNPRIEVTVRDVSLAADGAFTARGELALTGKRIAVAVKGQLSGLDAARIRELGLTASEAAIAQASFELRVAETALDPKNFDSDRLVVTARVALVPAPTP